MRSLLIDCRAPGAVGRSLWTRLWVSAFLLVACGGPATAVSATGSLNLTVSGLPEGAAPVLTLAGPQGFHQDLAAATQLSGLLPGSYSLEASGITVAGFAFTPAPVSQAVVVTTGQVAVATVGYAATDGKLQVNLPGVPSGTTAAVTITGPAGFSVTIGAAQDLSGLVPGAYEVTADIAIGPGGLLMPQPVNQTVTVVAGASAAVNVAYSGGTATTYGALAPGYHARSMVVKGVPLNYQLFIPAGYDPSRSYPVILFAHGSGEQGNNNSSQLTVGLGPHVTANASSFPAVVIFPQQPAAGVFPTGVPGIQTVHEMYLTALDSTLLQVHADPTRLYLTGVSVGAFRSWGIAFEHPTLFAALAPVSGGVATQEEGGSSYAEAAANTVTRLRNLPIWMWHGDADGTVPIAQFAYPIRDAFIAAGSPSTYHFVVGVGRGHELEVNYTNPAFWTWLWAQHR